VARSLWGYLACAAMACSSNHPAPSGGSDATAEDARQIRDSGGPSDGGTPLLADLVVSRSNGSTASTLVPSFSPEVFDYYVRCETGGNALTVSLTATPGSQGFLVQPTTSPAREKQTVLLIADESQAIVVGATDGARTTEYWVRCLPHDFPKLETTLHADAGVPSPGYYLIGNYNPLPGTSCYAMVLDRHGVPVWYALAPYCYLNDVDLLVSGTISFAHYTPTVEQTFELHQLDPVETTYAAPDATALDEHELRVLPNGHFLVISDPVLGGVDLTGVTLTLADGGTEELGPNSTIQNCDLVEFDPKTGDVLWKWIGTDHLDPVKDSTISLVSYNAKSGPDGGPVVDSFHCNAIDVDTNGNLLVSARHMDSIFYVDRSTGAILWKMGGAAYTKDSAIYVAVADPFHRQHDARLQPGWSATCFGGSGQISLFDDETFESAKARAVVYDVVVGGSDGGSGECDGGVLDGGTPGTAMVAWQHPGVANSIGLGSFRILADGSRTIGWGVGAPNPAFSEVDVSGHELFEVSFPDGNGSYRAIKVPLEALDLEAMRRAVGLP
jgi:Arylsulfotransferase (ASST)